MGFMRATFLRVFSMLDEHFFRYADDVHLIGRSEDVLRHLGGLTLKVNKMHVMQERKNFLGAVIQGRRITVSPHQAARIRNFSSEMIKTVSELRSFLGLLFLLSKFQNQLT